MFSRFTFVLLASFLSSVFLSGCATTSQTGVMRSESAILPSKSYFGHMVYSMESQDVARGMRELEDLLWERFPQALRGQDGEVPEEYLAAMYRDASGGDRHISEEEFALYKDTFLGELEHSFPNPLRPLRRGR